MTDNSIDNMAKNDDTVESIHEKGSIFKQIAKIFSFKNRKNGETSQKQKKESETASNDQSDSVYSTSESSRSVPNSFKRNSRKNASGAELQWISR